jgi:hypothetical protein
VCNFSFGNLFLVFEKIKNKTTIAIGIIMTQKPQDQDHKTNYDLPKFDYVSSGGISDLLNKRNITIFALVFALIVIGIIAAIAVFSPSKTQLTGQNVSLPTSSSAYNNFKTPTSLSPSTTLKPVITTTTQKVTSTTTTTQTSLTPSTTQALTTTTTSTTSSSAPGPPMPNSTIATIAFDYITGNGTPYFKYPNVSLTYPNLDSLQMSNETTATLTWLIAGKSYTLAPGQSATVTLGPGTYQMSIANTPSTGTVTVSNG